ncbi:MAG: tRNA uridine(34) 5-carboxymethylaminomethyl modification radical SAM/GNAT enzyme Elp3 [Thermoplasmata archaeon]
MGRSLTGTERGPVTPDVEELHRRKLAWVKQGHPGPVPSNVAWLEALPPEERARQRVRVRRKPTRTLSGVAVVAVMTAPAACPHGRCTYCPGGLESRSPQSYTGEEPSALRGAQFHYDARAITQHRLESLETIGHPTSKVEVILMGGTFPSRPRAYRLSVFQGVFDGLNGVSSPDLASAQRTNETASHRCVSLTVETRPDWCDQRILPELLEAGVTRVEIGVECLRDDVLAAVGRAHGTEDVVNATREARDQGLKVCYHWMLGLPGMDPDRDFGDFERLWDDPRYRPDMLKIYPTLVLPGTGLYDEWKAGRYSPYSLEVATELIARIKAVVPRWVRIQRIQRDIPARLIAAGVRAGNLRQQAQRRMVSVGQRCQCLRCREVGRREPSSPSSFELTETQYPASGGTEVFLSFEDISSGAFVGFLRMRFPSDASPPGLPGPVIRELKVVGSEVPVGERASAYDGGFQHTGFGARLVARAEELARDAGFSRLYVLSAVGTREYYRRLGYGPEGPHMWKPLST